MPNIDNGLSKQFLVQYGIREQKREKEMLFDLYLDPVERENKINDSTYAGIVEELTAKLTNWMETTGDPLLKGGKVSKPESAYETDRHELNP